MSEPKRRGRPPGPSKTKREITFDSLPDIMTAEEYAAFLRVNKATVYDGIKAGTIPHMHLGRAIRISKRKIGIMLGYYDEQPNNTVAS